MPFVNNDGIQIHYQIEGNGPPLVLQHGLGDSIGSFYEYGYVEQLKGKFQLIMIEARGHGQSDKPHEPAAYDSKLMVGDILAVMDSLKIARFYFFGFSMGCRLGFEIARYAPERIIAYTMGGHHPYAFSLEFFRNLFKSGLDAWIEIIEASAGPLTPSTRERLMDNDINALRAAVAKDRTDISDVLPSMTVGCGLFAGTEDSRYDDVKRAAFEIPNGRFLPIAGLNHFQSVLRGDLVAPLVNPYIISMLSDMQPSEPINSPKIIASVE